MVKKSLAKTGKKIKARNSMRPRAKKAPADRVPRLRIPQQRFNASGDLVVAHRELIGSVDSTQQLWKIVSTYVLSVSNSTTFPWLSGLAKNYESYVFRRLRFDYVPNLGSGFSGRLRMSVDYDVVDPAPNGPAAMSVTPGSVESPVGRACAFVARPQDLQKRKQWYTRQFGVATTDARESDVGNLFISLEGCLTPTGVAFTGTAGDIWVDYEVALMTPQFDTADTGDSVLSDQVAYPVPLDVTTSAGLWTYLPNLPSQPTAVAQGTAINFSNPNVSPPNDTEYRIVKPGTYLVASEVTPAPSSVAMPHYYPGAVVNGTFKAPHVHEERLTSSGSEVASGFSLIDFIKDDLVGPALSYVTGSAGQALIKSAFDFIEIPDFLIDTMRLILTASFGATFHGRKDTAAITNSDPLGSGIGFMDGRMYLLDNSTFVIPHPGTWLIEYLWVGTGIAATPIPVVSVTAGTGSSRVPVIQHQVACVDVGADKILCRARIRTYNIDDSITVTGLPTGTYSTVNVNAFPIGASIAPHYYDPATGLQTTLTKATIM